MSVPKAYVALAEKLADAAGPIVAGYFRKDAGIQFKSDRSPVTLADTEAEAAMRAVIEAECPDHGILGEEGDDRNPDAEYMWVLDPIDGTKSFASGAPMFGTLIGLARNGRPVLGVIDQPVLGERWSGYEGGQTTFNGAPASVRNCREIKGGWLHVTSPDMFEGADADAFKRLENSVRHVLFGGDCYHYGLLASGFVDLVCEAKLKPWDFCALGPVIEGAGGRFTDWQGNSITLESDGRILAAGDAVAHASALAALNG